MCGGGVNMQNEKNAVPETVKARQVYLEMLFLAAALVAIWRFVQNTPVMSVVIGVIIAARFIFIRRRHDWIFFLIGFVAGGGNDLISMAKGVYYYTPHHLLPVPIPIWMLVFWGHIFVAFRQLFQVAPFQPPTGKWPLLKLDTRFAVDLATVIILRIIIYRFVQHEPYPTIGYAAVIIARLAILRPAKFEWMLMSVIVPLGVLYEGALIKFGLYVYYDPVFLGMPAWLIMYWVFMIPVFVKSIFDRIEYSLAAKSEC